MIVYRISQQVDFNRKQSIAMKLSVWGTVHDGEDSLGLYISGLKERTDIWGHIIGLITDVGINPAWSLRMQRNSYNS